MQISMVKQHELNVKPWGAKAGYMSEVYRYPAGGTEDDYLIRFSTATIEIPVSDFTLYPGYIRHHRTLDGLCQFDVDADNKHTVVDQSGTVFKFFGESQLRCKLTSQTAFAINLIHKPHVQVSDRVVQVEASNLPLDELLKLPLCASTSSDKHINILYIINGDLGIEDAANGEKRTLSAGDTLIVTNGSSETNNGMWRITHCSAKIYHGIVLPGIP